MNRTILETILFYHKNPDKFVTAKKQITDKDLNIPVLGEFVEQDDKGWFIKQDGEFIVYCAKHSRSSPESDGPQNLELLLAEAWGRYTRKNMSQELNFGFRA